MAVRANDIAFRPHEGDELHRDSAGEWLDASSDAAVERIIAGEKRPPARPTPRPVEECRAMELPSKVAEVLSEWDEACGR